MSNMSLSDDSLRKAAHSVRKAMLTSLPNPTDCENEFTNDFQTKMEQLRIKAEITDKKQKAARSIASVFLVLIITSTLWLTVNAEAREIVFAWFRETYENSILYRFFGQNEAGELPQYELTWLPEGFEQEFEHRDEITHLRYYQKQNSLSGIAIEYYKANDGTHTEFIGKDVESLREEVYVNGKKADFYRADGNSNTNNLIWMEKKSGIVFIVSSDLGKSVIIRVAESLKQISVKK